MENPWKDLKSNTSSLVLPADCDSVECYNSAQRASSTAVITESVPEPFIGNPDSARLILLGLNPGHSESDRKTHCNADFRQAMFLNLRHELGEYPFYPLNPAFAQTGAAHWWTAMLQPLMRESRLDDACLSERLMVIEWFPYHSEKSNFPRKQICGSQTYSFALAKHMVNSGRAIVLGMRSKAHWSSIDPIFERVPFLKNRQRPFISRGNMDANLFDSILRLLRQ